MARVPTPSVHTLKKSRWFHRSGWFFLVLACAALFYSYAIQQKRQAYLAMTVQLKDLEREKREALALRDDLMLQIASESDPAWVEMVLKRNLGMVQEGQVKVFFQNNQ